MAEVASAFVSVAPSLRGGGRSLISQVEAAGGTAGISAGRKMGVGLGKAFRSAAGTVLAAAGIGKLLGDSLDEAREAQKVGAQTSAVIKSTGGAANVSAKQFGTLANSISKYSGIDDEAIQSAENLLATFTSVKNLGPGKNIFSRATKLATDMSVALKTDASSAALQLGKALNDPAKGFSRLQRSGVSFSATQIEQIKNFQKTGQLAKAQGVILGEVAKEFKGSAAAQATAGDKAQVAFKNLEEQVGTALLPVIDKTARFFTNTAAPAISTFVTQMQNGTGAGGRFVAKIHQIVSDGRSVVSFFTSLPGPIKKFGVEALIAYGILSKFGPRFGAVTSSISAFTSGLSTSEGRLKAVSKASFALGSALKQAGGVGGMLLLADGSKRAGGALSTLETTAGGALAGFAAGGPIGAAIGGATGLLLGLFKATRKTGNAFSVTAGQGDSLRASLDQITGHATAATRALILSKAAKTGLLAQAGKLGVSGATIADAVIGRPEAIARVNVAVQQAKDNIAALKAEAAKPVPGRSADQAAADAEKYSAKIKAAETNLKALQSVAGDTRSFDKQGAAQRIAYAQAHRLSTLYKAGFPRQVATEIRTNGVDHSMAAVKALARQYNATPKEIVAIAKLGGYDLSLKQARAFKAAIDAIPRTRTTVLKTVYSNQAANQHAQHGPGSRAGGRSIGTAYAQDLDNSRALVGAAADRLGETARKHLSKKAQAIRDNFKTLHDSLTGTFTQDLFTAANGGALTAKGFLSNLSGTSNNLSALLTAFKTLKGFGLPANFLSQLFAQGGSQLILELASNKGQAQQAASLFGSVNALSNQLGTSVAGNQFHAKGTNDRIDETNRILRNQNALLREIANRAGDGGTRAAANARRRSRVHRVRAA